MTFSPHRGDCTPIVHMALAGCIAIALSSAVRADPWFSIDAASPSVPGVSSSDVLSPGPVGGPPTVAATAASLGLAGPPVDELDAITTGGNHPLLHISVDRASVGAPPSFAPDVDSEAAAGQAAGDVFLAGRTMSPLAYNQSILGLLPAVAAGTAVSPPIDDVDALDLGGPMPALFSLAAGHPYPGTGGVPGCGSDLFSPGPLLAVSHATLGLACADDIDALHLDTPSGGLFFSLAPGSPSLAAGSPISGCETTGCSAADLFGAPGGAGPSALVATASYLGLDPGDDVDALAQPACLSPSGTDTDGDGVDDACDNCTLRWNADQWDAGADGYGNACDGDYDQNGGVGITDFARYKASAGCSHRDACFEPESDHNGDNVNCIPDFAFFRSFFGRPLGPSGLACAGTVPCTH